MSRKWLALLFCLSACTATSTPPGSDAGQPPDDGGAVATDGGTPAPDGGLEPTFGESAKGAVKFKKNERIANDLAQALGLSPADVCQELGRHSCTAYVHSVTLGGVEPYTLGLNVPLPNTSVTTPIAVERVVLHACTQRIERDLAAPASALLAKDLAVDASGGLADLDAAAVDAYLTRLYQRALLREPRPSELAALKGLYGELAEDGGGDLARDWAVLACFSVLTTTEALFY